MFHLHQHAVRCHGRCGHTVLHRRVDFEEIGRRDARVCAQDLLDVVQNQRRGGANGLASVIIDAEVENPLVKPNVPCAHEGDGESDTCGGRGVASVLASAESKLVRPLRNCGLGVAGGGLGVAGDSDERSGGILVWRACRPSAAFEGGDGRDKGTLVLDRRAFAMQNTVLNRGAAWLK